MTEVRAIGRCNVQLVADGRVLAESGEQTVMIALADTLGERITLDARGARTFAPAAAATASAAVGAMDAWLRFDGGNVVRHANARVSRTREPGAANEH